jgi:hypothetical protein
MTLNDDMRIDRRVGTDLNIGTNYRVRANRNRAIEFSAGIDYGSGVDSIHRRKRGHVLYGRTGLDGAAAEWSDWASGTPAGCAVGLIGNFAC